MPEPQGHSQDDASCQLGRKRREADVTHCSSSTRPQAAMFRWEQKACFSSFCKALFTLFMYKSILPSHCPTPATCFVLHTTRATLSSLLCEKIPSFWGCAKPLPVPAGDFFPKSTFVTQLKWKAQPYPRSTTCATQAFRRAFQQNLGSASTSPFSQ